VASLPHLWRWRLPLLLLLTAAVRLIIFFAFPRVFDFVATGAIHGSSSYDVYAQNLLATGVYGLTPGVPDAVIPPLYSCVLAGAYGILGRSALTVALLHILLDCISVALVHRISARLLPNGEVVGVLAALMTSFYPYLVFQNLTLIDTPLYMTLLMAFVYGMIVLRARPHLDARTWGVAALVGVIFGLSLLIRPLLPLLAVFCAFWFLFRLSLLQTAARLLPVAVVGGLVIVPWIVRNFDVFGAFVPMTTTSGANFWQGNSRYTIPYFQAGYDVQWTSPAPEEIGEFDPNSREADARRFALGIQFLRENPDKIPELLWTKFLIHWSIDVTPRLNPTEGELPRVDYRGNVIREGEIEGDFTLGELPPGDPVAAYSQPLFDQIGRTIHRFYFGGLLILSLIGVVLTRHLWREVSLLWFVQIALTIMYVIFHPSTRYRVPTDPLLFIFGASALIMLALWWRSRARQPMPAQMPA
jgi:hypothetical protein